MSEATSDTDLETILSMSYVDGKYCFHLENTTDVYSTCIFHGI